MKQILVMMAAVVLVGCGEKAAPLPAAHTPENEPEIPQTDQAAEAEPQVASKPTPEPVSPADEKLITDPIVEEAIRSNLTLNKPTGELTEADLEKVTGLSLSFTKITDTGLKEVAKLKNLNYLRLDDTKITDAGLKELAKLQKLTILGLNDTQVTDAGVAELKKALPDCEIAGP